jgi:hypothetical protein
MADGRAPDSPSFTSRPTLRNLHDAGVVVKEREDVMGEILVGAGN